MTACSFCLCNFPTFCTIVNYHTLSEYKYIYIIYKKTSLCCRKVDQTDIDVYRKYQWHWFELTISSSIRWCISMLEKCSSFDFSLFCLHKSISRTLCYIEHSLWCDFPMVIKKTFKFNLTLETSNHKRCIRHSELPKYHYIYIYRLHIFIFFGNEPIHYYIYSWRKYRASSSWAVWKQWNKICSR